MVPVAGPRLTRVGFRRDIKFFLASLVGFLIILILSLVLLLQNSVSAAADEVRSRWNLSADAAAEWIERSATSGDLQATLVYVRGRYSIDAVELHVADGKVISSGLIPPESEAATAERVTRAGRAVFSFDAAPITSLRRQFVLTAAISIGATILGAILLILYLPRITRPIEQLLGQASELGERGENVDEEHYLIQTFRSSIARLKEQEVELIRLHDAEKNRADDLQLITATLTRSLTSGFVAISAEGRIVDLNAAAREILRLPPGEFSGRTIEEAFGPQPFSDHLRHALTARQNVSRQEVIFAHTDGNVIIGLTTVPLLGEEGRFLGAIALFADLTPVRSLEARLREMQTLADLGEISAGIAHEFRNSLSTILGYLKLARREALPEDAGKRVRSAEDEAAVLSRAVEGLLNFARPMTMEFQPTDLSAIVLEVVERLRSTSPEIHYEMTTEPATIFADRALMHRAIENLVRNSIDAVRHKHPTGGTIAVRVSASPAPRIEISDDGIGIDPSDAPRYLLPFQSGKPTGLGLGLPLARKIVLLHGGTLRLTGEPGVGASVTLDFFDNTTAASTPASLAHPELSRLQQT